MPAASMRQVEGAFRDMLAATATSTLGNEKAAGRYISLIDIIY